MPAFTICDNKERKKTVFAKDLAELKSKGKSYS